MDKYTYNLKSDKIQALVRRGDYETAAKIADTMEWNQEKNVRLLNAAADAYEKMGKNAEATELLLRAYEHSSAGKRILYKLTELALAAGNMKDAETFFKKYVEEAGDDNDRYVLRYKIAEARNESNERKLKILEAYHRLEPDEEVYACKLAELYKEAGRKEECVAICDNIILWFGVGPEVDRAMELKEFFEPLTEEQEQHRANRAYYEAQVQRIAEEMERTNAAQDEKEQDPQDSSEAIANYSASVDSDLIQELMEEEIRETEQQAAVEETLENSLTGSEEGSEEEAPAEEEADEETAVPAEEEAVEEPVAPAEEEAAEEPVVPAEEEAVEETAVPADEEPAKSIVIPAEFRSFGAEEQIPGEEEEEPVAKSEVPVIAADDIAAAASVAPAVFAKEKEREEQAAEPPMTFEHEHCIFLPSTDVEEDTNRAVDALDEYYSSKNQEMAKVRKISAVKLNRLGLIGSLPKLIGNDLIIDQANKMTDELLDELLQIVDHMDQDKLFVLIDQDEELQTLRDRILQRAVEQNVLTAQEEALPKIRMTESESIPDPEPETEEVQVVPEDEAEEAVVEEVPEETEEAAVEEVPEEAEEEVPEETEEAAEEEAADEDDAEENEEEKPERVVSFENIEENVTLGERDFIRYAEYFAHELECALDDSAYDALEEEMADILKEVGVLTAGDVEDLIEDAADQAEKKKFGKKYNKEGFLILRKKNFK